MKIKSVCNITFRDGVEVSFLAHGSQQWQGAGVHPYLGVTVIFPGVILDHIEQTADQVEHAVLGVILQNTDMWHICDYPVGFGCANRGRSIFFVCKERRSIVLPGQQEAWPKSC